MVRISFSSVDLNAVMQLRDGGFFTTKIVIESCGPPDSFVECHADDARRFGEWVDDRRAQRYLDLISD